MGKKAKKKVLNLSDLADELGVVAEPDYDKEAIPTAPRAFLGEEVDEEWTGPERRKRREEDTPANFGIAESVDNWRRADRPAPVGAAEDRRLPSFQELAGDDGRRKLPTFAELQAEEEGAGRRKLPTFAELQAEEEAQARRKLPTFAELQAEEESATRRKLPTFAELQAEEESQARRKLPSFAELQAEEESQARRKLPTFAELAAEQDQEAPVRGGKFGEFAAAEPSKAETADKWRRNGPPPAAPAKAEGYKPPFSRDNKAPSGGRFGSGYSPAAAASDEEDDMDKWSLVRSRKDEKKEAATGKYKAPVGRGGGAGRGRWQRGGGAGRYGGGRGGAIASE